MAKHKTAVKRLPPYRAPFYFGPEYLRSAAEWKTNFTTLLEGALAELGLKWAIDAGFGDWTLRVRFEHVQFVMCARTGIFMLEEYSTEDDPDDWNIDERWLGPINEPHAFYQELLNTKPPSHLEKEVQKISSLIHSLTNRMSHSFKRALASSNAAYEARLGDLRNDFQRLELDQLVGLEIKPPDDLDRRDVPGGDENLELSDAIGRSGEVFYSVCVVPIDARRCASATAIQEAIQPDDRFRYPPDQYDPVIERIAKEVKRLPGKRASQAEVKRRSSAEFDRLGWPIPKKTAFDERVKKIFKAV